MSTDNRLGTNRCPKCGKPSIANEVCERCSLAASPGSAGSEHEPDGYCVWCSDELHDGKHYVHPITRECFCTKECAEDYDANV